MACLSAVTFSLDVNVPAARQARMTVGLSGNYPLFYGREHHPVPSSTMLITWYINEKSNIME